MTHILFFGTQVILQLVDWHTLNKIQNHPKRVKYGSWIENYESFSFVIFKLLAYV